eukprot:INCI14704.3.p2 GENE.INCI14704.3~~INCI14704.3.p2  ORF type:complete len:167 (+),score=58.76 INCI14704.3:313-813(+)
MSTSESGQHTAPPTRMLPRKKKKSRKSKRNNGDDAEEVTITFRNYAPSDAPLPADDGEVPQKIATISAVKQVEADIEKELQQSMVTNKDEAVSITAKSPDWDLKRDIADKLKKLDRATLRAIRDMVQERIAAEKEAESSSDSSSGDDDDDGSSSDGSDNDDSGSDS